MASDFRDIYEPPHDGLVIRRLCDLPLRAETLATVLKALRDSTLDEDWLVGIGTGELELTCHAYKSEEVRDGE